MFITESILNLIKEVLEVTHSEKEMWEINIRNDANEVATEYGPSTVKSMFARYDAHGFYNLSSCYYSEVFANLEMIVNDN